MTDLGFRRWREYRLRKLIGFFKPRRQLDPAHLAGCLIFLPTRTRKIPARDALDWKCLRSYNEHRTSFELIAIGTERCGILTDVGCNQMIGNRVVQEVEPEQRQ